MMSLYELIEGMLGLLVIIRDSGAMTKVEEHLLSKYEAVWYNYYEKDLKEEK